MTYKSNTSNKNEGYVAPVLGNGNMSFQADYEGTMQNIPDFEAIRNNPDLRIWWAGRRYMHKPDKDLVSFGNFEQRIFREESEAELRNFEQTLDTKKAVMHTLCGYDGGISVETEMFIHHDYNLIAVKKNVKNADKYYFDYNLCDVKGTENLPELMTVTSQSSYDGGVDIEYRIEAGMYPYKGIICFFSGSGTEPCICRSRFSFEACGGGEFYILFCDNVDCEDYIEYSQQIKSMVLEKGFERLKHEHCEKWLEYTGEGYAVTDNELINNAYNTAQYHLKCYMTNWSMPVGLNNGSWQGRYFAFDEFYMLMGLLTSNHMDAAVKIPKFRYDGLETALFRCGTPAHDHRGAEYPWETLENGTEGAPYGFWLDHVFHMACISCGEYYYYKFTNDMEFLKKTAYPVIKNSALFYMNHMIYRTENGKVIIGKCTDLERLGPHRENAYMTTCGVIKTLIIFNEVSEILGVDRELAAECVKTAEELKRDLPNDGRKYIPYADCEEISIALLSGTYPFDVIESESTLQKGGIDSYLESESRVGNMYAVGTGVCSWYMTWKALVFARLNKKEKTLEAIGKAAGNTGFFGEMYEINDTQTKTIYRPWFTTAAGMLVHSVNEMLMQYNDEMIFIAPALPENMKNFSFRLAAHGALCVEVQVKDGCLEKLRVEAAEGFTGEYVKVSVPQHILVREDMNAVCQNGNKIITVKL